MWLNELRLQHHHCCSSGHCSGTGLIPDLGTSNAMGVAKIFRKRDIDWIFFSPFLGPHPRHMEVPRLALAYATATATLDLSLLCNLHHSSR